MEQLDIKDMKIQQLEETIEKLKEIIKWQSMKMANLPVKKLNLKK